MIQKRSSLLALTIALLTTKVSVNVDSTSHKTAGCSHLSLISPCSQPVVYFSSKLTLKCATILVFVGVLGAISFTSFSVTLLFCQQRTGTSGVTFVSLFCLLHFWPLLSVFSTDELSISANRKHFSFFIRSSTWFAYSHRFWSLFSCRCSLDITTFDSIKLFWSCSLHLDSHLLLLRNIFILLSSNTPLSKEVLSTEQKDACPSK